ncbi:hypothetical protein OQA88_7796 [Cercophora sp. LCS_1]
MRGFASPALWLVPVVARAASVVSAGVQLQGSRDADFLSFRLDVYESGEPCGLNATIGGEPLIAGDASTFTLHDNLQALGQWKTLCMGEEILLMLSLDSVQGLDIDGVDLTIRLRQIAPVEIFDVAGPAVLTHLSNDGDDDGYDSTTNSALAWGSLADDLDEDIADLMFLREMASELEREIQFKQAFLNQIANGEEENQQTREEDTPASTRTPPSVTARHSSAALTIAPASPLTVLLMASLLMVDPRTESPHTESPHTESPHTESPHTVILRSKGLLMGSHRLIPHSLFYSLHPLMRIGIMITLFFLLVVALRARCHSRGNITWAERREMRRARCRAKRAAMRRRWRAFLDRMRPDESDDEGESGFGYAAHQGEKAGLLLEYEARGCQEGVVVNEKGDIMDGDDEGEAADEKQGLEEEMTMSQEISSFRDVAQMVGDIVAAEEGRGRI